MRVLLLGALLGATVSLAQPVTPGGDKFRNLTVTGRFNAPTVNASFVDAGVLSVNGPTGVECVAGFDSPDTATRAICLDQLGGTAITASSKYLAWNTGTAALKLANNTGDITIQTGTNNIAHLSTGAGGAVRITGSQSVGTCTLNGGSPATCTATVRASSICTANPIGTTAAAAKALAVNLATTTLTVTAANGSTEVVNYHCF